jgi:hypothetical protein
MRKSLVLCVVVAASHADAQPAGAQAEVLFRQGRALMSAGKTEEACRTFAESQRLDPATTTLMAEASCREKLGQLATAWGLFLELERSTRAATDGGGQQLHELALKGAEKLEPRVSKLTINVPQKSQVDGLEIYRNKDLIDSVMWNRALPSDGGTYTIVARARGSNPWSTQITIANEGDVRTVEIPDLSNLPHELVRTLIPAPAATPTEHPTRVLPFVVGGAGILALGGALAFDLSGSSTYDDSLAATTNASRLDLWHSANDKRYAAEALGAAGIASVGVAVWLYIRGHETAVQPVPVASTNTVGLFFVGGF